MLYIGEKVGRGGPEMDIAVDPLEGTNLTAKGGTNALAVIALAERGNFLHAPDIYMDKIAVGGGLPGGVVDIDASAGGEFAQSRRAPRACDVARSGGLHSRPAAPRGTDRQIREAGARIMLISDGDVAGRDRDHPAR